MGSWSIHMDQEKEDYYLQPHDENQKDFTTLDYSVESGIER